MPEYYAGLEVVEKILSDPVWRERSEKVKRKDELIRLLVKFCGANGQIIRVDNKTILLFADRQP